MPQDPRLLILLSGFPGVGKSTISKEMGERLDAHIIDIDDFKKGEVDPTLVKTQIDPPELRWKYYQKALAHVFSLFEQGKSVLVMDEVFHLQELRLRLEASCREQGVMVIWVEVRCDYDIVKKRLQRNNREGHILSSIEALKMNQLFAEIYEDFSPKQNHIVVNNNNEPDMAALTEQILQLA
jgi:predicted kinase